MRFSVTRILSHRQPSIRFPNRRAAPAQLDHTPKPHPASESTTLPSSFAAYRQRAQQHGPLTAQPTKGGRIGGASGASLGAVEPKSGEFFDNSELPARFRRRRIEMWEIEAVESAGGSLFA